MYIRGRHLAFSTLGAGDDVGCFSWQYAACIPDVLWAFKKGARECLRDVVRGIDRFPTNSWGQSLAATSPESGCLGLVMQFL